MVFELGCATIEKPDTNLCIINAPAQHQKCYNIREDYNDNGRLKSDAVAKFKPAVTIEDLNKNMCTDPDGLANLKTYIKLLREAYANSR